MSYGRPYLNRHEIFTTFLLVVSALSGICLLSTSWAEDQFEVKDVTNGLFKIVGPLTFIFLFYGLQFLLIARKFQLINDQTNLHIELIRETQQIFQTFHHFRDFYIGENADKELPYKVKDIFTTESQSFVHQKMSSECKRLLNGKDHIANEYIEKLVGLQTEFIREIKKERKFYKKTVLGLEVNFATIGIIFVGYVFILGSTYFNQWADEL